MKERKTKIVTFSAEFGCQIIMDTEVPEDASNEDLEMIIKEMFANFIRDEYETFDPEISILSSE